MALNTTEEALKGTLKSGGTKRAGQYHCSARPVYVASLPAFLCYPTLQELSNSYSLLNRPNTEGENQFCFAHKTSAIIPKYLFTFI